MGVFGAVQEVIRAETAREGKYLTFLLHGGEYGIRISSVREIIRMMPITPLPHTPKFVMGVINLRGEVIPVVDLRLKLGMSQTEGGEWSCIIITELRKSEVPFPVGIVVDSVSEVAKISRTDVEEKTCIPQAETDFILGIAKNGGRARILLDISRLLGS